MRTRSRVDANQKELTAAFRKMGCDVLLTHQLGKGYPDCFVGKFGLWEPVEFKSKTGKLTKAQKALYSTVASVPFLVVDIKDAAVLVALLECWNSLIRPSKPLKKANKAP